MPKPQKRPRSAKPTKKRQPQAELPGAEALAEPRQEMFAQLMADGRYSRTSCYAQSHPNVTYDTARAEASTYLAKPCIQARIKFLRDEMLKAWTCEKVEVMRFLHQVVFTPVGYVDEESPMAQEVQRDLIEKGDDMPDVLKVKIKTPGKVEAAKLLAQMQGWEKPKDDPLAKAVDGMTEMIRWVRAGGHNQPEVPKHGQ